MLNSSWPAAGVPLERGFLPFRDHYDERAFNVEGVGGMAHLPLLIRNTRRNTHRRPSFCT